jgi:hypothetical protein
LDVQASADDVSRGREVLQDAPSVSRNVGVYHTFRLERNYLSFKPGTPTDAKQSVLDRHFDQTDAFRGKEAFERRAELTMLPRHHCPREASLIPFLKRLESEIGRWSTELFSDRGVIQLRHLIRRKQMVNRGSAAENCVAMEDTGRAARAHEMQSCGGPSLSRSPICTRSGTVIFSSGTKLTFIGLRSEIRRLPRK